MRYLSLFSGIGGFELGIQKAYVAITYRNKNGEGNKNPKGNVKKGGGLVTSTRKETYSKSGWNGELSDWPNDSRAPHCVGYSEIDKYAIEIYEKKFKHKNFGDVTKIVPSTLPDFELLVGGFPCQPFSIAGKRGGFDDVRGTLFFDIARIIKEKRPRLLLLENVKGLLSHAEGKTFATILRTLDELGYDLQWQVLNSKNFGVPQNRERVFIVANLRGTPRPKVFPILGSNPKNLEELTNQAQQGYRVYKNSGINPTLASQAGGVGAKTGLIAHTVRAGGGSSGLGKKQNWDSYLINKKIRRLTPKECERLQGFPDGYTETVSDNQRYKTLGGAVTVNVIKAIIEKMI